MRGAHQYQSGNAEKGKFKESAGNTFHDFPLFEFFRRIDALRLWQESAGQMLLSGLLKLA